MNEETMNTNETSKVGDQSGGVNVLTKLTTNAAGPSTAESAMVLSLSAEGTISTRDRSLDEVFDPQSLYDRQLFEMLLHYTLTGDQLKVNRFPYFDIDGQCLIQNHAKEKNRIQVVSDSELRRNCLRCGTEYRLTEEGEYEKREKCQYHWGKETWYDWSCCKSDISVKGCCFADRHVSDSLKVSDLQSFVQSQPRAGNGHKIYAVDCEMVYSVWGKALARVSVIDRHLQPVLDVLVKPVHELVDCNSRFSGLRPDYLEKATHTFEQAREAFLDLVSNDTILVGHSLEWALRALRVVHERVIDTSVLFPHRRGPPYKKGLKTLMAEHMKKKIQEDVFDSNDDAASALKLVFYKLNEDQKVKKPIHK